MYTFGRDLAATTTTTTTATTVTNDFTLELLTIVWE